MSENLKTKEYSNGEVTVVWKPSICIHSEKCFKGLPEVFDPESKPWIDAEGASSKEIMEQVDQCPSGALSYYTNEQSGQKENGSSGAIRIQIVEKGPIMVEGSCTLVTKNGEEKSQNKMALCRCGASTNKPYCDGSHKEIDFDN